MTSLWYFIKKNEIAIDGYREEQGEEEGGVNKPGNSDFECVLYVCE